jgi:hypothetical protein
VGLNAALVDRARAVRLTPVPEKVEGKTISGVTVSAWFRARLELPAGGESGGPGDRQRVVVSPTLMCGVRDSLGGLIAFNARDQIEVDSRQLGHALWEATQDPSPIRKKRRVIGWEVALTRVEDNDFLTHLPAPVVVVP